MIEYDIIRKKMEIKKELLLIMKSMNINNGNINFNKEIYRLYTEYLKLYVQVSSKIPKWDSKDFASQYRKYNCYFYALDFIIPQMFINAMRKFGSALFYNSVGIISSQTSLEDLNRVSLIDTFYADMDALNIRVYNSDKYYSNIHDGYKIGIYIDDSSLSHDYHFIRENSNGSFSHKVGYFNRPEYIPYISDIIHTDYHYELIKTVEIVKPTIKR